MTSFDLYVDLLIQIDSATDGFVMPYLMIPILLTVASNLIKVARNGVEKLHFVLFNDLLVYGQAKRRRVLG